MMKYRRFTRVALCRAQRTDSDTQSIASPHFLCRTQKILGASSCIAEKFRVQCLLRPTQRTYSLFRDDQDECMRPSLFRYVQDEFAILIRLGRVYTILVVLLRPGRVYIILGVPLSPGQIFSTGSSKLLLSHYHGHGSAKAIQDSNCISLLWRGRSFICIYSINRGGGVTTQI